MSQLERGGIDIHEDTTLVLGVDLNAMTHTAKKKRKKTWKPLTWNVYYEDFNARRIVIHNVFNHAGFYDDCRRAAKKYKDDKEQFAEAVRHSLMYYYWSKCEWEVILTSWPPHSDFHDEKIDVYDQVRLNWDRFIDYLWTNRGALNGHYAS